MANHAYLVSKRLPKFEQVLADIQGIVARRFPQFEVVTNKSWIGINHKEDKSNDIGISLWYEKFFKDKRPCLNFRHGHCYRFLWWFEFEIQSELCKKYKIRRIYDEGTGWYKLDGEIRDTATYADYIKEMCAKHLKRKDNSDQDEYLKYQRYIFDEEKARLPEDLHSLLGELV